MSTFAKQLNTGLNLASKLAVVAGGSQGIGEGIAIRLAQAGSSVIVVGRNEERLSQVVDRCRNSAPAASATYDYISADLSLILGIKQAISSIKEKSKGKVDYLFQTQGGPPMGNYNVTKDGIEQHFAIQVLSRFALTEALASDGVLKSASVNIAAPGSSAITFDLDDAESQSSRNSNAISLLLAKAKNEGIVTDAYTLALQAKYPSIRFYHLFPGPVTTNAAANQGFPFPLPQLFSLFGPIISRTIGNSATSYADIPVLVAANDSQEKQAKIDGEQGRFLSNYLKRVQVSQWASQPDNQRAAYRKMSSYLAK